MWLVTETERQGQNQARRARVWVTLKTPTPLLYVDGRNRLAFHLALAFFQEIARDFPCFAVLSHPLRNLANLIGLKMPFSKDWATAWSVDCSCANRVERQTNSELRSD
jgi:hypothetical protein